MTRVLLIRPLVDALPVAKALEAKGMTPLLYPLFEPHFLPLPALKTPQALVITSKNSIRALAGREDLKFLPLYVVGEQTALLAHQKGFSNVLHVARTSQELTEILLQTAHRDKGILYHLSGEFIKGDMVGALQRKGLPAEREMVYRLEEASCFSEALLSEIKSQKISYVMFFSPRTTTIFVNLFTKHELKNTMGQATALCLSHDVAKKASRLAWNKIWISPQPTTEKIMGYFDEER